MTLIDHNKATTYIIQGLQHPKWSSLRQSIVELLNNNKYPKSGSKTDKHLMWVEQSIINFPLLYVCNLYIYILCQELQCDTVLFATRDCCHMVNIFKAMFPNFNCHYFHCSRNMLESAMDTNNQYYKTYVNSLIKTSVTKTMFIDIHGTGKRCFDYFEYAYNKVPYVFLISSSRQSLLEFPEVCQKYANKGKLLNMVFGTRGGPIESLNYDKVGTLIDYNSNGPVRQELEYKPRHIRPYHKCIKYICQHIVPIDIELLCKQYCLEELGDMITYIFKLIVSDYPVISKKYDHIGRHKLN